MAYLLAHCQGQVTMPVELERTELGGVLRKATSLNQNDRYPSAKEFQEALAAVSAPRLEVGNRKMAAGFGNRGRLDSMDVLGETSPGMTRNTPPSGTPAVVPVVSQTSAKSDAALRWTLGALVILIILGLGVVATLMNRNSDTPDAVLVEPEVPVTVRDELPTPEAERPVVEVAKQPSTPAQEPVEAVAIPEPVLKDVPVKTVKSTKSTTKSKTADEKVKVGPKVDPSVAKKDPPQVEVKPPSSEPTPNEGKTTKAGETAIIAP